MTMTAVRAPLTTDPAQPTSVWELSQLLVRTGAHDEAAFGDFYDATSSLVYGLALRFTKEPARAEEATAEVYLAVWRSAPSFAESDASPVGWLLALVYTQLKAFPSPGSLA